MIKFSYIYLFLFILLGYYNISSAQANNHSNSDENKKEYQLHENLNEQYILLTDRNLYCVGEKIYFNAWNISPTVIKEKNWSKVLYVELIKQNGLAVKNAKYEIDSYSISGYLEIPENMFTGIYYLKVYTKWMRNFSSESFSYIKIKVINPYDNLVELISEIDTTTYIIKKEHKPTVKQNIIQINATKNKFKKEEKIEVHISSPDINMQTGMNISVVKEGTVDENLYGITKPYAKSKETVLEFIPDLKGMSISGTVIDKNKKPVKNGFVQLSVLGDNADYLNYMTGKDGKFYFTLPKKYGHSDMFIMAENTESELLDILVDKDFELNNIKFEPEKFVLDSAEKALAQEIAFNRQIQKMYGNTSNEQDTIVPNRSVDNFYGTPTNVVYIDEYVSLPNLGEVIFELVPDVFIVTKKGKTSLRIEGSLGGQRDKSLYKPLVLLDGIPIHDLEAFLEINPQKIARIEVINSIYIKGNKYFSGVISMFSKKGDFAGIDLPEKAFFFDYTTLEKIEKDNNTFMKDSANPDIIPDVKNCLYWNPSLKIAKGESKTIDFKTTNVTGKYIVLVRGINKEGDIIEGRWYFNVE